MIILQEDLPTEVQRARVYYHGTPREASGLAILEKGIQPPDLSLQKKTKLTPRDGKVYMTTNLSYAVIYCVGANMLGSDLPDAWLKESQYGYLFCVKGSDLRDIEPDEDSVGEFIHGKKTDWLLRLAQSKLTSLQYRKVMDGEYTAWASAGRKLIPLMTSSQRLELIELGAHVAHTGAIIPTEAWKFDRGLCKQLQKDASNFFDLAEKVR